ncbi:MAG: methylated-DNA--[protein]-cysteine S-methyltransferase [Oscillospiraceae bacterium]
MENEICAVYSFPGGNLKICCSENAVISVSTTEEGAFPAPPDSFCQLVARQLFEYFKGRRRSFELPISEQGTAFQKRVWAALRDIPYGETRSYKFIAEAVGSPKAFRAVGGACNKNPILIITPCHRVIGSGGALVGFACGLDIKKQLLELEGGSALDRNI